MDQKNRNLLGRGAIVFGTVISLFCFISSLGKSLWNLFSLTMLSHSVDYFILEAKKKMKHGKNM